MVEVDDLLAAQPAGVGQLQHRPVAQLQRGRAGIRSSSARICSVVSTLGSVSPRFGLETSSAGLGRRCSHADQKAVEAADRGQLAADGRRRGAGVGEAGRETADVAVADVARRKTLRLRPLGEATEVDRRRPGGFAPPRPACPQVAVVLGERVVPVHGRSSSSLFLRRRPSRSRRSEGACSARDR